MYADPPPLSKTLFGKKDEGSDNPNEPSSFFNQAALTVGSLLLVVVFLVVSGGPDLANFAQPRKPVSQVLLTSAFFNVKQNHQNFVTCSSCDVHSDQGIVLAQSGNRGVV